jgi:hypothetical protein
LDDGFREKHMAALPNTPRRYLPKDDKKEKKKEAKQKEAKKEKTPRAKCDDQIPK